MRTDQFEKKERQLRAVLEETTQRLPAAVEFATKPALARAMVARVLAAGVRPAWVVADAVYGADNKLRSTSEEAGQPYVLAVTGQPCVWMGCGQQRVKSVKTRVPADAWSEIGVAAGTKGPRVFDWAALTLNHPHGRHGRAFYSCDAPAPRPRRSPPTS